MKNKDLSLHKHELLVNLCVSPNISKSTLYSYLRYRGVEIGIHQKPLKEPPIHPSEQIATITLQLNIENNSQFVRGKKRARENIERYCLSDYDSTRLPSGDYTLRIAYHSRDELDEIVNELLNDISSEADTRHCHIEVEAWENGTDYRW